MTERQTEADLYSESLQTAYNDFKELAQKYGKPPREGMTMPTNGRVFSIDIPNEKNKHNHPDNIGGRYFGPGAGRVEIFYRHEDTATQINLVRNSHGKVTIDNYYLYALVHVKTGYTLHTHRGENLEPNIDSLNELLQKAKQIIESSNPQGPSSKKVQRSEQQLDLRRSLAIDMANLHLQKIQSEKSKRKNR